MIVERTRHADTYADHGDASNMPCSPSRGAGALRPWPGTPAGRARLGAARQRDDPPARASGRVSVEASPLRMLSLAGVYPSSIQSLFLHSLSIGAGRKTFAESGDHLLVVAPAA